MHGGVPRHPFQNSSPAHFPDTDDAVSCRSVRSQRPQTSSRDDYLPALAVPWTFILCRLGARRGFGWRKRIVPAEVSCCLKQFCFKVAGRRRRISATHTCPYSRSCAVRSGEEHAENHILSYYRERWSIHYNFGQLRDLVPNVLRYSPLVARGQRD